MYSHTESNHEYWKWMHSFSGLRIYGGLLKISWTHEVSNWDVSMWIIRKNTTLWDSHSEKCQFCWALLIFHLILLWRKKFMTAAQYNTFLTRLLVFGTKKAWSIEKSTFSWCCRLWRDKIIAHWDYCACREEVEEQPRRTTNHTRRCFRQLALQNCFATTRSLTHGLEKIQLLSVHSVATF